MPEAAARLPYFIGCPSWNEPAWAGTLYPARLATSHYLQAYCQAFNAVEGNTTLYAWPSPETVRRWAEVMPEGFHFCAKFPQDISHAADLSRQIVQARQFVELLAPLGPRAAPLWLQLPARFSPARLPELQRLLASLEVPLAVEVRHPDFFARGAEERALNRLLRDQGVERICLDSRGLFSCPPESEAVRLAQGKKPRLPIRAAALSTCPQVRLIGHPELAANDRYLDEWARKVSDWLEAGLQPHVFLHTPDNLLAPQLAARFHLCLQGYLPGLPDLALPDMPDDTQLSLLD